MFAEDQLYVNHAAGNGHLKSLGGVAAVSTFSMTAALVLVALVAVVYLAYVLVRKSENKKKLTYTWPEEEEKPTMPLLEEKC